MRSCSVCKKLKIVPGCYEDYKQLAHYHYRGSRGPFTAIFTLKPEPSLAGALYGKPVGVIVYSTTTPELELRNVATNNFYTGFDRSTRLALVNRDIRRISRVIIEPRFRGLGLASKLVVETMPLMNVPIIEAVGVMALVNPFLEKAGMEAYAGKVSAKNVRLIEALGMVGIEEAELVDVEKVQQKLDRLEADQADFIENEMRHFLKNRSGCRYMQAGLERTRYVLNTLTARPVYYIWFNPKFDTGCSMSFDPAQDGLDTHRESGEGNQ
jgi:hypothetical protein